MFCSQCGVKNDEGNTFCMHCGAEMKPSNNESFIDFQSGHYDARPPRTVRTVPVKKGVILFVVGMVLLGAVIGGLVWTGTGPRLAARYYKRGTQYLEQQSYEKAVRAFNQSLEAGYTDVEVYLALSAAYVETDDLDGAVDILHEGLDTLPPRDKIELHSQLTNVAGVLLDEYRFDTVIDALKDTIEINPENEDAYLILGDAYAGLGDESRAVDMYLTCYESTGSDKAGERLSGYTVNTYGNTIGNTVNNALAVRQGDWIYYATMDSLCKIRTNGGGQEILCRDFSNCLNVIGGWVYYRNNSDQGRLYRIRTDGTDRTKLNDDCSYYVNVYEGWIYYYNESDAGSLHKIRTDGTDDTLIVNTMCFNAIVTDGWVYYFNSVDTINRIRTSGKDRTAIHKCENGCLYMNVVGDWIYYCKADTDRDDFGYICRVRTDGTGDTVLIETAAQNMNIAGEWIFYTDYHDGGALCKVRTDGTERTKLCNDNASLLSVTGDWVYYQNLNNDETYRISTDGRDRELMK